MSRAYVEGTNESDLDKDPPRLSGLQDDQDSEQSSKKKTGDLLELPPEAAAKKALRLWESQDRLMSRLRAQWKANELRRRGIANVQLIQKSTDTHTWEAWCPPGSSPDSVPAVNHAAQICRKAASLMFADPPAPEAVPPSGDEEDVEAAEFSDRVLEDLQGESQLDDIKRHRKAFDRASTFGSGFVRYYIDAKGERAPKQIKAGVDQATGDRATTVDNALQRMVPAELDPVSGMPVGEPIAEDWPDYEDRFVGIDGMTLVDDERDAEQMWLPRIRAEVLTGKQCRFVPHTAEDIWDADGFMIAAFVPYGKLRKMFELGELTEEQKKRLFGYRPQHAEDLVAPGEKNRLSAAAGDKNEDETLVFVLTTYYRECGDYPEGAYVVTIADIMAPVQEPLTAEIDGRVEVLDIPVTQQMQLEEGRDGPYKVGLMEIVGAGNNIRGAMIGTLLDHLDKFNTRKIFVPVNSIISEKDLMLPNKTVIPVNPGGEPSYEDLPTWPTNALEMFALITEEQQNAVGLGDAAQGLDAENIESGRHALAAMAQAHAALSEIKENIVAGYTRGCRIQLQLVRAHYDAPRRLKWEAEDGEFRMRAWSNADLRSTKDVRLKPGTMTMLTPSAKVALAERFLQSGSLSPEQFKEIMASNMGGDIGLEDDVFRLRIKRQISVWAEGPPEGWVPPPPQTVAVDPASGQQFPPEMTEQAAAQGAPLLQVPGADPVLAQIWEPRLADELPEVAAVRLMELARLMSTRRYDRQPPEWRVAVDMEFERMRGVAEAAMAAQQAAEMGGEGDAAASGDANEKRRAENVATGGMA